MMGRWVQISILSKPKDSLIAKFNTFWHEDAVTNALGGGWQTSAFTYTIVLFSFNLPACSGFTAKLRLFSGALGSTSSSGFRFSNQVLNLCTLPCMKIISLYGTTGARLIMKSRTGNKLTGSFAAWSRQQGTAPSLVCDMCSIFLCNH